MHLRKGRDLQRPLPDVDVIFQRFKDDERLPPNSKALAHSHVSQQVVKLLKLLPEPNRYPNLPRPEGMYVEQLVLTVERRMRCQMGYRNADLQGSKGFDQLLTTTLKAVAGMEGMRGVRGVEEQLQLAGMAGEQWRRVAQRVLKDKENGKPWPATYI